MFRVVRRPAPAELASVLLPLALFLALVVEVELGGPGAFRWERRPGHVLVRLWRDEPVTTVRRVAHRVQSRSGALIVAALVAAAVLAARRPAAVLYMIASAAVLLLTPALKDLFARPPPRPEFGAASFPSGHAIGTMSISATLVVIHWRSRLRWPLVVLGTTVVLGVGAAVVADEGHWPADVIAGWLLALAWIAAFRLLLWKPVFERITPSDS